MRAVQSLFLGVALVLAAPSARAADDDTDLLEDEEDLPEPDMPDAPPPAPEDLDALDEDGDLLDETTSTSSDSAEIYRTWLERVEGWDADEEVQEWERYLEKYPDTSFRQRIEERIEVLMAELYDERIDRDGDGEGEVDADLEELPLSQPLLLENINPRSRVQVGFEWGFPTWINLYASGEYAFFRTFSVHGGVRHRYTGWSIEAGVTWSPLKSNRTGTIVSLIGDVRFNTIPAFAAFRPQVGVGQIIADIIHVQLQVGTDIEARRFSGVHLIGGGNVTVRIAPPIGVFVEANADMKNLTWKDGGVFTFDTATFGFKFYPRVGKREPGAIEANIGGTLPFAAQYWAYHFGSVMAQANYYFPE